MLATGSEYYTAWGFYLVAVASTQLLVWRITRSIPAVLLQRILQLCSLAILITPARLETGQNYFVPAFMAALMEGVIDGGAAAVSRILPIILMMLILCSAYIGIRLRRQPSRSSDDTSSAP